MKLFFVDIDGNDIFSTDEVTISPNIRDIIEIFDDDKSKCKKYRVQDRHIRYAEHKKDTYQELEMIITVM